MLTAVLQTTKTLFVIPAKLAFRETDGFIASTANEFALSWVCLYNVFNIHRGYRRLVLL